MKMATKDLKDCEFINYLAYSVPIMRKLKKEDDLYLDELFLLGLIYKLVIKKGKPVNQLNVSQVFNILSYKRDKMLANLTTRGYVNNDMQGDRGHFKPLRLSVSPLGEQLLIKYKKAMERLCEGS